MYETIQAIAIFLFSCAALLLLLPLWPIAAPALLGLFTVNVPTLEEI